MCIEPERLDKFLHRFHHPVRDRGNIGVSLYMRALRAIKNKEIIGWSRSQCCQSEEKIAELRALTSLRVADDQGLLKFVDPDTDTTQISLTLVLDQNENSPYLASTPMLYRWG